MCDIFTSQNCKESFRNMFILMIGDSNMKSYYKDLIYLITHNEIGDANYFGNPPKSNRRKSFCKDTIRTLNEESTGRDYFEDREFMDADSGLKVQFCFITNIYGKSMKKVLSDLERKILPMPNVILLNSCLWDLTRWGPKKEETYMKNLISVFGELRRIIPASVQVIWTTTPPLSVSLVKGGVFIQQLEFTKHTMRFMAIEANSFVRKLCILFERDLLDIHYHLRYQIHRRSIDGIHWEPHAVRHVVCLILTHIAISFKKKLPGNFDNPIVHNTIDLRDRKNIEVDQTLPDSLKEQVSKCLKIKEPAAIANLKSIKMRDALGISENTNVTRKTKKARRRLAKKAKSKSQNPSSNDSSPSNHSLQIAPTSSQLLQARLNFDNNRNQSRPGLFDNLNRQSGHIHQNAIQRDNYNDLNNYTPMRRNDKYNRTNFNNMPSQPSNLYGNRQQFSNSYYAGPSHFSYGRQPYPAEGLHLTYQPQMWSSLQTNFTSDETCFDHYALYRRF